MFYGSLFLIIERTRVVAQKESHTERAQNAPFAALEPAALAALGKKRIQDFANTQTELLDKLKETNGQWFDRVQSEANLTSEFGAKLTAARSLPDAMTACQEWASRRFEMMAEDRKHLLADYQMFSETGVRLLSKYWLPNGFATSP
jgi:hypothetical protein